jgi:hypothetical protein
MVDTVNEAPRHFVGVIIQGCDGLFDTPGQLGVTPPFPFTTADIQYSARFRLQLIISTEDRYEHGANSLAFIFFNATRAKIFHVTSLQIIYFKYTGDQNLEDFIVR